MMENECFEKIPLNNQIVQIVGYSVMGHGKIENQDSFLVYHDDEQIIVAIADGLGSATFSKEGATKVVAVLTEFIKKKTPYNQLPLKVFSAWKETLDGDVNLYDTTVKFVHITEKEIVCGGVGDGWIAMNGMSGDNYFTYTTENTFSNQTDSILSFNLTEKFRVQKHCANDIQIILIATDGFSEDIEKDQGRAFLQTIGEHISKNPADFLVELKTTMDNWPVSTNTDDKTAIVIRIGE